MIMYIVSIDYQILKSVEDSIKYHAWIMSMSM